jgi:hypothetical protein
MAVTLVRGTDHGLHVVFLHIGYWVVNDALVDLFWPWIFAVWRLAVMSVASELPSTVPVGDRCTVRVRCQCLA